jgi:hypothetical protein
MTEIMFVSVWFFLFMAFLLSKYVIADDEILGMITEQPKMRRDGSDWGVYIETEP